jgi:hypothetical protein
MCTECHFPVDSALRHGASCGIFGLSNPENLLICPYRFYRTIRVSIYFLWNIKKFEYFIKWPQRFDDVGFAMCRVARIKKRSNPPLTHAPPRITTTMRSAALAAAFLCCTLAHGFHATSRGRKSPSFVVARMSSPAASAAAMVPIIIDGRNIEVTPALEDYVNKRIGGTLSKLSSNGAVRECDVILSVSKNPKVR